ncbi:extensin-like [Macadamia integrifolia]|uniref:extensin-like n=1 Tax=Macadamia integrifolia TaxID=60698 RepID=UPI001C4FD204|nr:extensin-like [Macadamia integrifolia]
MDLSDDYEEEFADALPAPPPFTPYPMPVPYAAPPPPMPISSPTPQPVPPPFTPAPSQPPKTIHTIITPSENALSEYFTNLTITDPLSSFMNEGPRPTAPHVSEMDDDPEIHNPEDPPRPSPVPPPTPYTPYQNQDPKQFFTLDDMPVPKWASRIADFHAWINVELLHEGASTVTV